uniref:Putative vacuolar protein sorting-associated protein 13A isoform X7 n=1 Tax=Rhizophora mucronata TaxID=61149 RepID=A0A2P2MK76_RHIMU
MVSQPDCHKRVLITLQVLQQQVEPFSLQILFFQLHSSSNLGHPAVKHKQIHLLMQ